MRRHRQQRSRAAGPAPQGQSTEPESLWRDGLGRAAIRALQSLVILAVVVVVIYGLIQLKLVLIPILLALILASAFNPLMRRMRSRGVPDLLATVIALGSAIVFIGGVIALVAWTVERQWDDLVESSSEGLTKLQDFAADLPLNITSDQLDEWKDKAGEMLTSSESGSEAIAGITATASVLTGFVLMVVILFFFLKDGPKIWQFLLRPFDGQAYDRAIRIGTKTVDTLGGYARGTAMVAAVDAIGIGVGLLIVQVPLAIPLAVIVFLTAFIPIVGATLAGILAALVALVTNGPIIMIVVVGIVVLVNQLESHLLQPVIMSRVLRLHALVILLALTAGTILAGVIGAVVAVPTAAVAWGILNIWNGPNEPARAVAVKDRSTREPARDG